MILSKLKCVTEISINGEWVREDKLDPEFVKRVIYDRMDLVMKNNNFINSTDSFAHALCLRRRCI